MARPNNIDDLLARLQEEGRFAVVLWGRWDDEGAEVHDDQTSQDDFGIDATHNMSPDDVRRCIVGTSMVVDPDLGVIVRGVLLARKDNQISLEDKLNEVLRCLVCMKREAILLSWPEDLPEGNGHSEPLAGMRINVTSEIDERETAAWLLRLAVAMKPELRPIIMKALDALS